MSCVLYYLKIPVHDDIALLETLFDTLSNGAWLLANGVICVFRRSAFCFRCGYTVSKVGDGSLEFVHETSVKHYKDTLTFTFADKV